MKGTLIKGKKRMTGIFDNTNLHEFARMTEYVTTPPLHHSTTIYVVASACDTTPLHPSTPAPHVVS